VILVLAGTRDGRELAADLARQGWPVTVTVVSDYGRDLAVAEQLTVSTGPLDADGLTGLIKRQGIRAVVDASHPYAAGASASAQSACDACGVPYIRYERPGVPLPAYDKLHLATDPAAAATLAAGLGKVIFLTTGSRSLAVFKQEPLLSGHRLIARVLPEPEVIAACRQLGFSPRDIVALQGPFSHELNLAIFREYGSEVVVTKNSGHIGGSDSKFSAAVELGLQLVVIDRPAVHYSRLAADNAAVGKFIEEVFR
jgi:precorrin-6A/cobalt-precorrin-6A reductase